MQAPGVVVVSGDVEFGSQRVGVGDLLEVGPLGLDVAEQRLDPCLVSWGAGPAEAGRDGAHGEELPGGACSHLGAVVAHDQQDRLSGVLAVAGSLGLASLHGGPQALGVESVAEHDLYLGGGLLGGDKGGEPFAGDDVQDGVGDAARSGEVGDVVDPDLVAPPLDPVRQGPRRDGCALRPRG